ncbi:uncharacterized protein LOC106459203 isoform X2 [Limulus polyphemus]|uniref:Uncharacterized protein LOC106459203 isoform X2 n=1 Tax=Limulus polyphemus TaxID=6850 RepID=A0ABM1B3U0_LIMPO|nr:uncharacterized protein LOC106459203 isoform X2 [Limulus polyphemus]
MREESEADDPMRISWQVIGGNTNNNCLVWEEERPYVSGIAVKAGTLDALIDLLVSSFLPVGGLEEENNDFPHVFLLMHQWFVSSKELAKRLTDLFWKAEQLYGCRPPCPHTLEYVNRCRVYQFRTRVCQAFRFWIRSFPIHFDLNNEVTLLLLDFQQSIRDRGYSALGDLVDVSKVPSYHWARSVSVRNPSGKHTKKKVSLVFDHLEPAELADHLTCLEHKMMSRITFMDIKTSAVKGTLQDNPKLERAISLCNDISKWIQCMVLSKSLPQQRADVIVKFVAVAKRLFESKNFNTLMAVVGGLNHSALARLSRTKACVPPDSKKMLSEFTELLSSAPNFTNYRRALNDCKGSFRIPILAVHMKDLISLNVALPDTDKEGLINFRKMAQLSLIFKELWELQNSRLPFNVNMDLLNTLRLSLDVTCTEDEIYELSLTREPRNPSSPQSSPTKPGVFAEWLAGVDSSPDPETMTKHIHSIVKAIFGTYDIDQDSAISQEEFEAIQTNFPFIDSFSVIDTDQDGFISKTEMKEYFLGANSQALKKIFRHDFHETSYFKPTFCAHCTGLLWGLFKQGYQCRHCEVNAHKHCKDLVVVECRRSISTSSRLNSFSAADTVSGKSRFQRPWRRHNKSSHSDGSTSPSLRLSSGDSPELCKCENGYIFVTSPLTTDFSETDDCEIFTEVPSKNNSGNRNLSCACMDESTSLDSPPQTIKEPVSLNSQQKDEVPMKPKEPETVVSALENSKESDSLNIEVSPTSPQVTKTPVSPHSSSESSFSSPSMTRALGSPCSPQVTKLSESSFTSSMTEELESPCSPQVSKASESSFSPPVTKASESLCSPQVNKASDSNFSLLVIKGQGSHNLSQVTKSSDSCFSSADTKGLESSGSSKVSRISENLFSPQLAKAPENLYSPQITKSPGSLCSLQVNKAFEQIQTKTSENMYLPQVTKALFGSFSSSLMTKAQESPISTQATKASMCLLSPPVTKAPENTYSPSVTKTSMSSLSPAVAKVPENLFSSEMTKNPVRSCSPQVIKAPVNSFSSPFSKMSGNPCSPYLTKQPVSPCLPSLSKLQEGYCSEPKSTSSFSYSKGELKYK